jgi:subtilisin family serine protease
VGAVVLHVTGDGAPLAHAPVRLILKSAGEPRVIDLECDAGGYLHHPLGATDRVIAAFIEPWRDYWPMAVFAAPQSGATVHRFDVLVNCEVIETGGPLGWWHLQCGIVEFDPIAGAGISIGVIDSGAAEHVALVHVRRIGVFHEDPDLSILGDVLGHGTHVAGIIGGRPINDLEVGGVAPGAEIFIARAFGDDDQQNNAFLPDALDALVQDHQVDLINLSFGSLLRSAIVEDAILDAYEHGVLCIAAAGNDGKAVHYPAALDQVVGIGALGLVGAAPERSHAASHQPADQSQYSTEGLYVASFSARGPGLNAVAPGVAIVSTVPARSGVSSGYSAKNGTSMAAPIVAGLLANRLGQDIAYRSLPRDSRRADYAFRVFQSMLTDLGLAQAVQGDGIPRL